MNPQGSDHLHRNFRSICRQDADGSGAHIKIPLQTDCCIQIDMSSILITLAIIIAVVIIGYYLVKKLAMLLVNALLGLILLFIMNFFHIMTWVGKPDLGYDIPTLIISAVAGVPGVAILVLLSIFGITL